MEKVQGRASIPCSEAWKPLELLGSATYILLGAKIWFVPGFNFNQKVFFHVLILERGEKNMLQSPGSKLESNCYGIIGSRETPTSALR